MSGAETARRRVVQRRNGGAEMVLPLFLCREGIERSLEDPLQHHGKIIPLGFEGLNWPSSKAFLKACYWPHF